MLYSGDRLWYNPGPSQLARKYCRLCIPSHRDFDPPNRQKMGYQTMCKYRLSVQLILELLKASWVIILSTSTGYPLCDLS